MTSRHLFAAFTALSVVTIASATVWQPSGKNIYMMPEVVTKNWEGSGNHYWTWSVWNGNQETVTYLTFEYSCTKADGTRESGSDIVPGNLSPGEKKGGWAAFSVVCLSTPTFSVTSLKTKEGEAREKAAEERAEAARQAIARAAELKREQAKAERERQEALRGEQERRRKHRQAEDEKREAGARQQERRERSLIEQRERAQQSRGGAMVTATQHAIDANTAAAAGDPAVESGQTDYQRAAERARAREAEREAADRDEERQRALAALEAPQRHEASRKANAAAEDAAARRIVHWNSQPNRKKWVLKTFLISDGELSNESVSVIVCDAKKKKRTNGNYVLIMNKRNEKINFGLGNSIDDVLAPNEVRHEKLPSASLGRSGVTHVRLQIEFVEEASNDR